MNSPLILEGERDRERWREALARLRQQSQTVRAAGAALGLAPERLAMSEALDRLEITASVAVERVLAWEPAAVAEWCAALEDDLMIHLTLTGGDPAVMAPPRVSLRAGDDPARALAAFQQTVVAAAGGQGADVVVEARLAVAKRQALDEARALVGDLVGEALAPVAPVVFYFAAAWERLLSLGNLPLWQRRGLFSTETRTCVLVGDAAGHLAGVALSVVGAAGDVPPRELPVTPAAWRRFRTRAEEWRRERADEAQWAVEAPALTPDDLRIEVRAPGLEETVRRLATLRAALAATYLASGVVGAWEEGLALRFAGARPAQCTLSPETGGEELDGDGLSRLASWAYAHGSPDKLAIARECLAHELPAGGTVTLAGLERAALPALEAAKANFSVYLRGQTEQYFTLRQAAQEAVARYAETVRKTVDDLTGDAVQDLYRTGGLAVGLFVAWLIQPAASLWAGMLGALLYSGYVAFILRLLLPAREERYRLEAASLERRLAEMPELTAAERTRLRDVARADEAYHARYAHRVRLLYLILLALGIAAFAIFGAELAAHVHAVASSSSGKR